MSLGHASTKCSIHQFEISESPGPQLSGAVMATVSLCPSRPAASFQLSVSQSPLPLPDCFFLPPSVGCPGLLYRSRVAGAELLPTVSSVFSCRKTTKNDIFPQKMGLVGRKTWHDYGPGLSRLTNVCPRPLVSAVLRARTKLSSPLQTFAFLSRNAAKNEEGDVTFPFGVRALILTGSCDRLPTAARVTRRRPDCISAQEPTATDSADGRAWFFPAINQKRSSLMPPWSPRAREAALIRF